MKILLTLLLFLIQLKLFGQFKYPKLNCEKFDYTIDSNTRMNISFLSFENYIEYDKDTIQKEKPNIKENIELNKIFQQKYPGKITENCINSKYYNRENDVTNVEFCDRKSKIKLVGKKDNFYIFKADAFEINIYLLFDTNSEVIYDMNNYPQILENGKVVIDAGYQYGGNNVINYYFFGEENVKYFELSVPIYYQLKNVKLLKSFNSNPKVIGNFIRYNHNEVSNEEGLGQKSDFDTEKYCRKLVMIFKN